MQLVRVTGWQILLSIPLQWRHNGHHSVSNHQPQDCLLNRLLIRRSKKTSMLRVTGLCAGKSPHKWPLARKCFHLMTSSCWVVIHMRSANKYRHITTYGHGFVLHGLVSFRSNSRFLAKQCFTFIDVQQVNFTGSTMRCRYNAVIIFHKFSQNTPNVLPVRWRYGVVFVDSHSDLYHSQVTAEMYAISCFIGSRFNGSRL